MPSEQQDAEQDALKDLDRKLYLRLQILVEQLDLEASNRVLGFIEGQIHAIREARRLLPIERR